MGIREALGTLNEAFVDLTSLHVQTFTGSIKFEGSANGEVTKDNNKYKTIETQIQQANEKKSITLVAESLYKFDGDSYNFITNENIPSSAIELHKSAVEAGIKTRQGLMEMAKNSIGL